MSQKKGMSPALMIALAGGAYLVYAYMTDSWPFNPTGPLNGYGYLKAGTSQQSQSPGGTLPSTQVSSGANLTAAAPGSDLINVPLTISSQTVSGINPHTFNHII